jgi:hypothetical protein
MDGLGRVLSFDAKRGAYQAEVNERLSFARVVHHLRSRFGTEAVWFDPQRLGRLGPGFPSLVNMDFFARHAQEPWKAAGKGSFAAQSMSAEARGARPKRAGPSYLQAYLQRQRLRAYPNADYKGEEIPKAVAHRDAMPAGRIRTGGRQRFGLDPGATWEFVGPTNLDVPYRIFWGLPPVSGRVNAIAIHPTNSQILYVGGCRGGVHKSTDGGATFTPIGDNWSSIEVSSIAIDPSDPNRIFVGGGDYPGFGNYSFGIRRSTDGGNTWTTLTLPAGSANLPVGDIAISPDNPNIIVAALAGGPAFWGYVARSTDGGNTWTRVINDWSGFAYVDFSPPGTDGIRNWYASAGDFGERLYRSRDNGATWTPLTIPNPNADFGYAVPVAASKVFPDRVYLLHPRRNRIYRSDNRGASWSDITAGHPGTATDWSQWFYNYDINTTSRTVASVTQDVVIVGNIDPTISFDSGATWRSLGGPTYTWSATTHNDQHSSAINPSNPLEFFIGNDGGFYRINLNPTGTGFATTNLNANLPITTFYTGDWHPTNANIMLGGTQDNATPRSTGNLLNWDAVGGGDGAGSAINNTNPNNMYTMAQFLQIYKTNDNWLSVTDETPSYGSDAVPFIGMLTINQASPNFMYVGTNYLWRYNNTTDSWTARLGGTLLTGTTSSEHYVTAMGFSPTNANRLFVGTSNGRIWTSADGGTTWVDIRGSGGTALPNRGVTAISVNPADANDVLVTLSGTGAAHLFRSVNATAGAATAWTDRSGVGATGLPEIPANTVARDPWQAGTWFVGTDIGAFMTTDSGLSWTNITVPLGLPNVEITAMEAVQGTGFLNVATYGRGMWRIRIRDLSAGLQSLTIASDSIDAGSVTTATVALSQAAPNATVVSLSSTAGTQVPATVTIPEGQASAQFEVTGAMVAANVTSTVTASLNATSVNDSVQVIATRGASFVSQNVPTQVETGALFPVQMTMKNVGSIPWTQAGGYRLGSQNPANNVVWGGNRVAFAAGDNILNDQNKTFSWNAKAPNTPGTYDFQWQSFLIGTGFFGEASPNTPIQVIQLPNSAQFSSMNVPTQVEVGQKFRVFVAFRNTGANPWTNATEYRLGSENPNSNVTWGVSRVGFPTTESIATGQVKAFEFDCIAPNTTGDYNFQWRMLRRFVGGFGEFSPNRVIRVVPKAYNAEFVSQTVPGTVARGTWFNVTIVMKNVGTSAWNQADGIALNAQNPNNTTRWRTWTVPLATGESVPVDGSKTFTFQVRAPLTAGTYNFQWRLFGPMPRFFGPQTPNVAIVVN